MKKLNSYFTEKQVEALQKLSVDTGLTVAELLRRAVDDFLGARHEQSERRSREHLRKLNCNE